MVSLKRPLAPQPSFTFRVTTQPAAAAANDAALKRRRVQYDRMRELEAQVQRVRHLGDALKQSLRQAEAQVRWARVQSAWALVQLVKASRMHTYSPLHVVSATPAQRPSCAQLMPPNS